MLNNTNSEEFMKTCLLALSTALACSSPAWAAGSGANLPAYDTFSHAGAVTFGFANGNTVNAYDQTYTPGARASISSSGYAASARSSLGSNGAYSSYNGQEPNNWVMAKSNWFDQMTISGGSGTGSATFIVQLHGSAVVGAYGGFVGYQLGTSVAHPYTISSPQMMNIIGMIPGPLPTPYVDPYAISPVLNHSIEFQNRSNPVLADRCPLMPGGIPYLNYGGAPTCTPGPLYDQTFGTGSHDISLTLSGSFHFTYGEAFYLVSQLSMATGGLEAFTTFGDAFGMAPSPTPDGTGPTSLDFNSAVATQILLPDGAMLSSASGLDYNVSSVPLPEPWALMLPGLGLVGWRARKKVGA
jgi:hypothetical protein